MADGSERVVWSVAEVNAAVGRRFDDIPPVWVEGELRDVGRRGGNVYFAVADSAELSGSMRSELFDRCRPAPGNGERVQLYGRVEFWQPRARVRFRAQRIVAVGEGALRAQIAALTAQLEREGLLAPERKRPIPRLPAAVGLVTSAAGAARGDFLRNGWERFPGLPVEIRDVQVQGPEAERDVAEAVRALGAEGRVEVIVLARGGGSLQDLMAFNSERVARAIVASPVPVICAIGHERDRTIADLVADRAVSTPTQAAHVAIPDRARLVGSLVDLDQRLRRGVRRDAARAAERVSGSRGRLVVAVRGSAAGAAERVRRRAERAQRALTRAGGDGARARALAAERSVRAMAGALRRAEAHLERNRALLGAVSPGATIARGYAILRDQSGAVVVDAAATRVGDDVEVEMRDGRISARVQATGD